MTRRAGGAPGKAERGVGRAARAASATDRIPLPRRPYRDSAIFYGILAAILIGVVYLTQGDVGRAVLFAAGFFVVATAWSWWRFRQRLQAQRVQAHEGDGQRGSGESEP